MNKPKILTIIPARKGSKGIPSKNKKKILGKPLVGYSFEIASNLPDNYYAYVSSDDPEIIELAKEYKIKSNGPAPSPCAAAQSARRHWHVARRAGRLAHAPLPVSTRSSSTPGAPTEPNATPPVAKALP